jgi:hypothetical protein
MRSIGSVGRAFYSKEEMEKYVDTAGSESCLVPRQGFEATKLGIGEGLERGWERCRII